jgi:hypothetical protein
VLNDPDLRAKDTLPDKLATKALQGFFVSLDGYVIHFIFGR